jgi:ABC-type nitrate/sulfonate/bicarbonate transport system substrate-binding protein
VNAKIVSAFVFIAAISLLFPSWIHAQDIKNNVDSTILEEVTLQLIWKNQFQFAGYYAAKEKGFYEDVG